MNHFPLVSVIMPLGDNENFIHQSLTSILDQTYPNIEIILVTYDSHDKSLEIAKSTIQDWKKNPSSKVREIQFFKQDSGSIVSAINHGLENAAGNYLTILPPQDYFHPQRLEKLIEKMTASKLHLAFTRVMGIDLNNLSIPFDNLWKIRYEETLFEMINAPTIEANFLNENIAASIGNLIFSKKLYQEMGGFNDFHLFYCLDFILRSIPNFEISFINENLYYFRVTQSDETINETKIYKEELKQVQLDYFKNFYQTARANHHAPSQEKWFNKFYIAKQKLHQPDLLEQLIHKSDRIEEAVTNPCLEKKSKKKTTISLIVQNLTLGGGVPKLVLDLCKSMSLAGYSPSVLSLNDGPMRSEFEKINIPVTILPYFLQWAIKKGKIKKGLSLLLMILYAHFKTGRHVIINSASAWMFALPFALFSKFKKITWYVHESFSPIVYLDSGLQKRLLKLALNKKTFNFWFGSESTKNIWHSAIGVDGQVKYWSGIHHKIPSTSQPNPIKKLLAVGTVDMRKGTHHLVDAFIDCVKNRRIAEDVSLTVIGFPKHIDLFAGEIILKIYAHHLQSRIKLVACISADEIDQYYQDADLFLQTSLLECLPLSLLKAMSEGIPIISTDVNGCSEALSHQQTGYLCRPFSSIALAETIQEALANVEKTHEMGLKAQKTFNERFCLDITVHEILKELKAEP